MIRKTAMFSAHTIHLLHMLVRSFFIAFFILLTALFFWLLYGIQIDKLDIGRYRIDGLYIKLDKKLTLKATKIVLPKSKASPSFSRVDKTFDQIKYLLTFFDTIMLEKVNFENNHLTLLYADDVLYITSDDYEIAGNIERRGKKLVADVSLLYLKRERVTISGKLSYDLDSQQLETEGKFEAYGITGHFRAVQKDDEVIYALNTEQFGIPDPLIKRFHLNPEIEKWILDRVRAEHYRVEYLQGRISIEGEKVHIDPGALKGKVRFGDVSIRYHDALPSAHAKELILTYKKGNLHFGLEAPVYQGRDLNGTSVVIKHIVGAQPSVLILNLHAVSPIDDTLQEVLRAYGLRLQVTHTGKKNSVAVRLKIPLVSNKKLQAIVDIDMDKGVLDISGVPIHVEGGKIQYKAGKVLLTHVRVKEKWYAGEVEGEIDLSEKEAALTLNAKQLLLGNPAEPFVKIQNKILPLHLSYKEPILAILPSLKVKVYYKKNQNLRISLSDIGSITPYLQKSILGFKGGSLEITSKDLKQYHFTGMIEKELCFFYDSTNICYTKIPVKGKVDARTGEVDLYAFKGRFHADTAKRRVWLKDLNIDLKLFLAEQSKLRKEKGKGFLSHNSFVIIGENSHLRYGPYRLVTDSYDVEIFPNGDIKAIGSIDGDVVKFTKRGETFFLQALRVKDKMLHPLINFTGLKNGRYSLKKEGNPDKQMKGRIIIEGGVLSDFKAYSNTLAFINTLPALATLHSPGFSNKGFKIKEGVIEYTMTPKRITFDSVYLKGNSATVLGKGEVDLSTKRLDMKLAILTVREFGKMVSKIPLLGYILMGEDNSMTVGLTVKGTLQNPKVSTSVAQDILTLPLQILKRTITAPVKMGTPKQITPTDIPPKEKATEQKRKPSIPSSQGEENRTSPSTSRSPRSNEPAIRSEVPSTDRFEQLF